VSQSAKVSKGRWKVLKRVSVRDVRTRTVNVGHTRRETKVNMKEDR
jgi:hypothetical protein